MASLALQINIVDQNDVKTMQASETSDQTRVCALDAVDEAGNRLEQRRTDGKITLRRVTTT